MRIQILAELPDHHDESDGSGLEDVLDDRRLFAAQFLDLYLTLNSFYLAHPDVKFDVITRHNCMSLEDCLDDLKAYYIEPQSHSSDLSVSVSSASSRFELFHAVKNFLAVQRFYPSRPYVVDAFRYHPDYAAQFLDLDDFDERFWDELSFSSFKALCRKYFDFFESQIPSMLAHYHRHSGFQDESHQASISIPCTVSIQKVPFFISFFTGLSRRLDMSEVHNPDQITELAAICSHHLYEFCRSINTFQTPKGEEHPSKDVFLTSIFSDVLEGHTPIAYLNHFFTLIFRASLTKEQRFMYLSQFIETLMNRATVALEEKEFGLDCVPPDKLTLQPYTCLESFVAAIPRVSGINLQLPPVSAMGPTLIPDEDIDDSPELYSYQPGPTFDQVSVLVSPQVPSSSPPFSLDAVQAFTACSVTLLLGTCLGHFTSDKADHVQPCVENAATPSLAPIPAANPPSIPAHLKIISPPRIPPVDADALEIRAFVNENTSAGAFAVFSCNDDGLMNELLAFAHRDFEFSVVEKILSFKLDGWTTSQEYPLSCDELSPNTYYGMPLSREVTLN